jgi:hypothetical protein
MTEADKRGFAAMMALIQEVFIPDKPISKDKIRTYFEIFSPYELKDILRISETIIRSRKFSTFPVPAEFLALLGEKTREQDIELRALAAWQFACSRYEDRKGGKDDPLLNEAIRLAFGGWTQFGRTDPENESYDQHRFVECFKALSSREKPVGELSISILAQIAENRKAMKELKPSKEG